MKKYVFIDHVSGAVAIFDTLEEAKRFVPKASAEIAHYCDGEGLEEGDWCIKDALVNPTAKELYESEAEYYD